MTDRAAWLAERRLGIGGSDCSSLFNVGYGCSRRLWYDKRNTPPDFEREETKAMKLGNVLEPFFAEEYAKETGREVRQEKAFVSASCPELRCNIDRSVIGYAGADAQEFGVLEIKSVGRATFYIIKRTGLPEDYILQIQHGMLVTGWRWGSFAIGSRDSGELLYWDVPADPALHQEIISVAPKFWALVENGPAPERLEPDDKRCQSCAWRTTCQGEALIQIAQGSEYEQDESLAPLVTEYIERRALRKEAEELVSETKAELEFKLGTRGLVTAAGAKVQFYEIEKKEYVVKKHKERPLRVYEGKK